MLLDDARGDQRLGDVARAVLGEHAQLVDALARAQPMRCLQAGAHAHRGDGRWRQGGERARGHHRNRHRTVTPPPHISRVGCVVRRRLLLRVEVR